MATVDATTESGKAAAPAPRPAAGNFSGADLFLRALLFAATLSGLVVLVTSKQTITVPVALLPRPLFVSLPAKFKDSPALMFLSGLVLRQDPLHPSCARCGIMASATGAAGGVAWIGLKGNSHTRWNEICSMYGKFCRHIGGSAFVSLIASIILVLLAVLNAYSLYRRSH
ncbi:hypothetical protein EJB05_12850, partial [Eragrostis curvula]